MLITENLSDMTPKDVFPLAQIEKTLTSLTQAEWSTTLDLASGYRQVKVCPEDCPKSDFTTLHGLYEFQQMTLGNDPARFQRLMQR